MKILLIAGHGSGDSGAVSKIDGKIYKEADMTREVVAALKPMLEAYGASVATYPTGRDAFQDYKKGKLISTAGFKNYNYVLEIHFNSCINDTKGNGYTTGSEVYVTNREAGTIVEQAIMSNLAALGFKNRGVKRKDYSVIYTAKYVGGVSAALLELCFIDDADDVRLYNKKKAAVAQAIADGVAKGFGLKKAKTAATVKPAATAAAKTAVKKSVDTIAREVIAGKWGNGSDRKRRLKQAGYDYNAVQKRVNQLLK